MQFLICFIAGALCKMLEFYFSLYCGNYTLDLTIKQTNKYKPASLLKSKNTDHKSENMEALMYYTIQL